MKNTHLARTLTTQNSIFRWFENFIIWNLFRISDFGFRIFISLTRWSCLVLLLFIFSSCNHAINKDVPTGQGTIVYDVSYPDSNINKVKSIILPGKFELIFKNKKASFIATGGFGMVQVVRLLNYEEKKVTTLLLDAFRQNVGCKLTPDEIKENEKNNYVFEYTDETKLIAGIECKKAIVKDTANKSSFEIYFYDKIKFYHWNVQYKDFEFLLMEYKFTVNNLTMHLTAAKVDLTTPVDTGLFEVKGNDYTWVNQKEFNDYMDRLSQMLQ